MFTPLPDLTPRDSHSLWYTSPRHPNPSIQHLDEQLLGNGPHEHGGMNAHHRRHGHHSIERTPLGRLGLDEQKMELRRMNIQNFGSMWLKPPGVTKTLHQIREEKREQEEHREALRREQLAQELAEAEAAGNTEEFLEGEDMDDVQLDGAGDLDDEIPEAEGFSFADDDEDEEEVDADDDGTDAGDTGRPDHPRGGTDSQRTVAQREDMANDLLAARMRLTDDAFRQALALGNADEGDVYSAEEEEAMDEEHRGHILDEEDFAPGISDELDMGMDANLDDDIPDAESAVYEHTDTEADLSTSSAGNDDNDDDNFQAARMVARSAMGPPLSPTLRTRRSHTPRSSMDLSSILSRDGSSVLQSSPYPRRHQ